MNNLEKLYLKNFFPSYFTLDHTKLIDQSITCCELTDYLLNKYQLPWDLLNNLNQELQRYISNNQKTIDNHHNNNNIASSAKISSDVIIEPGAIIEHYVIIKGPSYICSKAHLRPFSFIRGGVLLESHSLVGHATEVKNSILLSSAKASHQSYLGNSIMGFKSNLGAGTKTANIRFDRQKITIPIKSKNLDNNKHEIIALNCNKFGAVFGDYSQTGCLAVTNPGTLIYPHKSILGKKTISGVVY